MEGHGQDPGGGRTLRRSTVHDGRPGTIAAARDNAAAFLTRIENAGGRAVPGAVVQDVQLVVSELVTNACRHAPGPCRLDLALTDTCVEVTVSDTGDGLPVPQAPDVTRVGRHGLEIVLAVCRDFEVESYEGGKSVHARIPLPAPQP